MIDVQCPSAALSRRCHTIYVVVMLLNVFQKLSPTSELYRRLWGTATRKLQKCNWPVS